MIQVPEEGAPKVSQLASAIMDPFCHPIGIRDVNMHIMYSPKKPMELKKSKIFREAVAVITTKLDLILRMQCSQHMQLTTTIAMGAPMKLVAFIQDATIDLIFTP